MPRATRNSEYTKEYNRKLILRLLRSRPMSRAEIARQTGLTRASVSLIANDLLEEGLVEELAPESSARGRMPTPLTLRGDAGYAIGIYLNRKGCVAGVVDLNGKLYCQKHIQLSDKERFDPIVEAIDQLVRQAGVPREKLLGIGISAPGPLDGESGRILNPPRFDLWHQTDVGPILSQRTGLPVFLENNATSLARYHCGRPESQGSDDFLLLLVDSGIGSGVVSKGKLLKGAGYFTSELGHTSININGRPCACGNIGCMEEYAAIPNLLKDSKFGSWKELVDAVEKDSDAASLLRQEAEYLSIGVVNLTNLLSIDTVLLAGELLYGAEVIAPIMESMINSRFLHRERQHIRVLPSTNLPNIKIIAAADIAFGRGLLMI